jgi:outer membrane lipoprotein-sorting protein
VRWTEDFGMTAPTQLRLLRWGAPAAAAAAVVAVASGVFTAQANPSLPPKTAGQLLVAVQSAQVDGLSGTVVQDSDLGLPQLPDVGSGGSGGSSSLTSLLTGSHTLRVWYAGEDKQRVALLGSLGETDVVHNGTDAWVWSSESNSAQHFRVPAGAAGKHETDQLPAGVTPQQAADAALKALDPTTRVSTSSTTSVAGRSAYELVLAPKDSRSLVGQVRLAVDSATSMPLRVQVFGKNSGDGPAFSVGFSSVSFDVPAASQFAFNPPPGAKVTEGTLPTHQRPSAGAAQRARDAVRTVGSGWTTVAVLPAPGVADGSRNGGAFGAFLEQLPRVSGSWGSGRLMSSTLVSALLTDDGRLVVGFVPPDLLYAAAAR